MSTPASDDPAQRQSAQRAVDNLDPSSAGPPETSATVTGAAGRGRGRQEQQKRWRVPLVIMGGLVLSVLLAAVNGLQLASLQRALGGLRTPEAQVGGYDTGYIELVRARMTDELLERYGAVHYLWDLLFPVVFAGTIILFISHLCAGRRRRWLLMLPPVLFAAADIAENLTLEALVNGPDVMASGVALASALTVLKTVLFALSLAAALLALLTRPRTPADTHR